MSCSICIDETIHLTNLEYMSIFELTCGHKFHYLCIKQWYEENDTSPNCRSKYKEDLMCLDDDYETDDYNYDYDDDYSNEYSNSERTSLSDSNDSVFDSDSDSDDECISK